MESSAGTRMSKGIWFICLLLTAAVFVVYWQAAFFDFTRLDDDLYVYENPAVRAGLSVSGFVWAFTTGHAANWHPLTWLSHMLDVSLYGLNPMGHHLSSLVLHILNTLLLFILLYRMTGYIGRSAFVAALFAVHPLHVESVAWVSERKDVLSTFFFMLTLLFYHRYTQSPSIKRYLPVLVLFVLGLMSKPMLVTLPFVLLLLDFWPLGRVGKIGWRRLVIEKGPFFVLAAASCVITFLVQKKGGAVGNLDVYPAGVRLANASVSCISYIVKMIWPAKLSVFYPHPGNTLPVWQVAGSSILLALITVLTIRCKKSRPYLLWGWLLYAGTLVPVIGIVQVGLQAFADRYTYIPYTGLFVAITWFVSEAFTRLKRYVQVVIAITVLMPLIALSYVQASYWQDGIRLLEHAITVTEGNYLAHNNLGAALREKGKLAEAERHYREALRIKPDDETAHTNLGSILVDRGEIDAAEEHLRAALAANSRFAQGHYNLANLLVGKGQTEEAVFHYEEAIRSNPNLAEPHYNLGNILVDVNPYEAADHYREALRIKPEHIKSRINLGTLLYSTGEKQEAADQFRMVLKLQPNTVQAHFNLGVILAENGDMDQAISHFRQALKLDPKNGQIHFFLSKALRARGDIRDATKEADLAKRLGYQP